MIPTVANLIALDIGEKRIGVAIADMSAPFPAPLTTLEASSHLATEFKALLKKHNVIAVVVGLPRNQNGERTAQTDRVEQITDLLKIPKDVPTYWQDESLTSVKAEAELEKRKKPYAKAEVDSLAATYILNDFIHTQASGQQQVSLPVDSLPKPSKKTKKHQKKHKSAKSKLLFVIVAILLLIALTVAVAVGWYVRATSPRTADDVYSVITVQPGVATKQIASDLEQEQVIRSAQAFLLYTRINSANSLQAGAYRLSSGQSVKEIVDIMSSGTVSSVDILIPPGLRLDQITAILVKSGYSEESINEAIKAVRNHPILEGVASNAKLEGYLFPDTYKVGPDTSAEQLIRLMLDTFEQRITPEIQSGLASQNLTLSQAVILASVVQKEVPDLETKQKVAQVFLKRFREGMPLGADPTFKYVAALTGQPALPNLDSPYNTRLYAGLPPTAISNFNITALQAVASPAFTNYTYFVSGDDGNTYFSNTLEEHQALTARYCTQLCR